MEPNDIPPMKTVAIPETVTVKRFAELLGLPVGSIIAELMKNGVLATINEEIDFETGSIIAADLGFEAHADESATGDKPMSLEDLLVICRKETAENAGLSGRAAVVTVLGHVDHGKTTLLDAIRKTSVAAGEAGGITQHLSAYQVKKRGQHITFIDTPGHEAFSAMRKRGVSIADIAILVVAADDGVQPQTREVISYLKERGVPVIVAINKIDKEDANPARIKGELTEEGIVIEEWGGKVLCSEISAKQNIGIDNLLEAVLLVAEVEDFKADAKRPGLGVVIESNLDPQKGTVVTALVKTGTFKVGQDVVAGTAFGRVRRMEDYLGRPLEKAGPSTPVTIYGFHDAPQVNDVLSVTSGKSASRGASRQTVAADIKSTDGEESDRKRLRYILKADVQGSIEAIGQILSSVGSEEAVFEEIASGVGAITESDVRMAESSGAVILGFNTEPTSVARRIAEKSGVQIESFSIIYKLVDRAKERLADLLPPDIVRTDYGRLSVLAIFKTGKRDQIIGGRVIEGKMVRGARIEIKRGKEIVGEARMGNLQQNKENATEVGQGNECGLVLEGSVRTEIGDVLIAYKVEERRRSL